MRRKQNLMAVVGLGSLGALLLAQPDPGGGQGCFIDKTPVPGACEVGQASMKQDPLCPQDPVIQFSDPCPTVLPQSTGFSEAIPQGFAGCVYRYYQYVDGNCVLSTDQGFNWPCKAAGGTSCSSGGGGNH